MDRETELLELYQEALSLTRLQAMAIHQDQWDELVVLLNKRESCLDRAEALLHGQPPPPNHPELSAMLRRLQAEDAEGQRIFAEKQQALMDQLKTLDHSKVALSGYLDALGTSATPKFFDQDQ